MMFNLIVVTFSIILVVVLLGAGLYYGGEVVTSKTQETDFAEVVNGAEQIKAAMELYRNRRGVYPGGVEDPILGLSATDELFGRLISDGYLSGVPSGTWRVEGLEIQRELRDLQQCMNINRLSGLNTALSLNGCPACSDTQFSDWPACEI